MCYNKYIRKTDGKDYSENMENQTQKPRRPAPFVYSMIYGLIVIAAAQLRIQMFTDSFVVSAGVILFALLMLILDEFSTLPVVFISAAGVMVTRAFAAAGHVVDPEGIWETGMPEFAFYIVYGILIYLMFRYGKMQDAYLKTFIALAVPDFIANVMEIYIRTGADAGHVRIICILLAVAAVRSGIILVVYILMMKYGFSVVKIPRSELDTSHVKITEISAGNEMYSLEHASREAAVLYRNLQRVDAPQEILEQAEKLTEDIDKAIEKQEYGS